MNTTRKRLIRAALYPRSDRCARYSARTDVVGEHAVRLVEDLADLAQRLGQLLAQRIDEALGSELALEPLEGARHFVRRGVAAEPEHHEVVAVLHLRALGEHALLVDGAVGVAIARALDRPRPRAPIAARLLAVRRRHQRRHRAHADAAADARLRLPVADAGGTDGHQRPRQRVERRLAERRADGPERQLGQRALAVDELGAGALGDAEAALVERAAEQRRRRRAPSRAARRARRAARGEYLRRTPSTKSAHGCAPSRTRSSVGGSTCASR